MITIFLPGHVSYFPEWDYTQEQIDCASSAVDLLRTPFGVEAKFEWVRRSGEFVGIGMPKKSGRADQLRRKLYVLAMQADLDQLHHLIAHRSRK